LQTFDSSNQDGTIDRAEFLQYYANLSASIDDDDYFELMIRNAWHISGGEGWCANTTCKRVLVTHADGSQSVEEITNDFDLDVTSRESCMKALKAQGMDDVIDVSLDGNLDAMTPAKKAVPARAAGAPSTRNAWGGPAGAGAAPAPRAGGRSSGGGSSSIMLG